MAKQIFVNLPVKDLKKTIEFFTKLGFKFNPKFTDENATCMIIGKDMFAMLLVEKFFKGFIPNKSISDARKSTEVLNALSVESRAKVDEMIKKAADAGGKEYRTAQDHGWMYGRAFEDLDGHIWEVFYMDESKMPEEMKNKGGK
jgi:predicted lactoylglutathione lyase